MSGAVSRKETLFSPPVKQHGSKANIRGGGGGSKTSDEVKMASRKQGFRKERTRTRRVGGAAAVEEKLGLTAGVGVRIIP